MKTRFHSILRSTPRAARLLPAYLLGSFDGKTFVPNGPSRTVEYGPYCYAAQTFSDIPTADGRRIQIAWMNGGQYPGMPFNQQMSIPAALTLGTTTDGPRLFKYPVKEVEALRKQMHEWKDETLASGADLFRGITGELLDIAVELRAQESGNIIFNIHGTPVEYDFASHLLANGNNAEIGPEAGKLKLRILIDRTSIEVFANDGRIAITRCYLPHDSDPSVVLSSSGTTAKLLRLNVWEMKSTW